MSYYEYVERMNEIRVLFFRGYFSETTLILSSVFLLIAILLIGMAICFNIDWRRLGLKDKRDIAIYAVFTVFALHWIYFAFLQTNERDAIIGSLEWRTEVTRIEITGYIDNGTYCQSEVVTQDGDYIQIQRLHRIVRGCNHNRINIIESDNEEGFIQISTDVFVDESWENSRFSRQNRPNVVIVKPN